ncbi:polysaccharide biosynthesis C-terminal domain-containing protein [Akkermansiaceae bacterium]|nr:polysaccharide biosynthesis C-terminal domain-containing protein [Akkermansiaceae bacterium]
MRRFLSDFLKLGISKGLIIVFGLSTTIIVSRVLGPEKNGLIAALLVFPSLTLSVGSLGLRQSVTYLLGKNFFTEAEIKKALIQIWFFTTVLSSLICFMLMRNSSNSGDNVCLVVLALMPIPFSLFNSYISGIFLGKNDIRKFSKINWKAPAIVFFATIVLVLSLSLGIKGYLVALIFGPLSVSLALVFQNNLINLFSFNVNWGLIKKLISMGIIYALALLAINLNYKLDIIFLDRLSSPFETGIYARGVTVAEYLWQIPMLLSPIVLARSAVAKNDKGFTIKLAQLIRLSMLLVGFLAVVLFLFSKEIIVLLYGSAFLKSATVFNVLLPGIVLLTFFKIANMDLSGKGKPWAALKAMIPALIVNCGLNFILIPQQGAQGAALASTISYILAAILFSIFYSKEVNVPISLLLKLKKSDFMLIINFLKDSGRFRKRTFKT